MRATTPRSRRAALLRWARVLTFGAPWLALAPAFAAASEEPRLEEVSAQARIAAPPDEVWALLSNLETWPEHAPDLATIELARGADGAPRVRQTTRVLGLSFFYAATVSVDAIHKRIDLALDRAEPGDFAHLDSAWIVTPEEDGGTLVELRSRGRLAHPLPGFLQRRGLRTTVDALMGSLVEAVASRVPALPPISAR